jgi:hypothetical protein
MSDLLQEELLGRKTKLLLRGRDGTGTIRSLAVLTGIERCQNAWAYVEEDGTGEVGRVKLSELKLLPPSARETLSPHNAKLFAAHCGKHPIYSFEDIGWGTIFLSMEPTACVPDERYVKIRRPFNLEGGTVVNAIRLEDGESMSFGPSDKVIIE